VTLGEHVVLESRVHVASGVAVGAGTVIHDGAILGNAPQDLKYTGEKTRLEVGENCIIREYCTLNRGTIATGLTSVGNNVLLMAYTHVAHDCCVEEGAVLANGVQLGGHVRIGKYATLGGTTAVQQFCQIGAYAFVGGTLKVDRDVPPASRALGNPLKWAGLNLHALRKFPEEFSPERILALESIFRQLYRSRTPVDQIVETLKKGPEPLFWTFFENWHGTLVRP
jgi:UDP-N-acetylglucosamine acyltransferase